MPTSRILLPALIAAIGGAISAGLLYHHHAPEASSGFVDALCGGGADSGCAAVAASPYSTVAGMPLAALGMFVYFGLALLLSATLFHQTPVRRAAGRIAFAATAVLLAADLLYLGVQAFAIGRYCGGCIASYAATGLMAALLWPSRGRAAGETLRGAFATREGRLYLFGAASSLVVLAAAVAATDAALANADVRRIEERLGALAVEEFAGSPVRSLDVTGAPTMGDPGAPIRIVVYSDFLCPYCRSIAAIFRQNMPRWGDRVQVAFMNYPLDQLCNPRQKTALHAGSCWAALGGLCAQEQERFWEFHDRVFENPPRNPSGADIMAIAQTVGIDTAAMKECMESHPMRRRIREQIDAADRLGITGTPRIFINGRLLPKLAAFPAVLRYEAERAGVRPLEDLEG